MERRIEILEENDKDKETRISNLERKSDVSDEKFNNIMLLLNDLKESIDKIAGNLQEIQKRPINLIYQVATGIILLGLGVAIGWK
jgi:tetrahydromethanopterin S-methyltransferase subunit G